ncbi:Alkylated DNA repair protein AlkB [Parasponia andersonii]|uniref:DNA N(6)-methyladenine demethylase n=1 Tax=Parasponia andersonii TaxID=3476 RepID=A0A2P5B446_PARAD|nr:Alkylated DNA repair protein AlkB [Parasponia andersonii]
MNPGRGRGRGRGNFRDISSPAGQPNRRHHNSEPRGSSSGGKDRFVYAVKIKDGQISSDGKIGASSGVKSSIASELAHEENSTPFSAANCSASSHMIEERSQIAQTPTKFTDDDMKLKLDSSINLNISCQDVEISLTTKCGEKGGPSPLKGQKTPASDRKSENTEASSAFAPFDICPTKAGSVKLKPPLLAKNRERRNETKRVMEGPNGSVIRPGMVILKSHISLSDQVKVVKQCRDLGVGPGGFYQPGYRDGAKLHLNMMCLGKNWDPETSKYGDNRPTDGAKPPAIPSEFYQLVEKAIKDSHSLIQKEREAANVEELLPWMTPNICLVNFYSANGRLGLHQDRDESPESIRKGLPVVSFSIGDTAEFLFGDQRDVQEAKKIMLESGDVLIFGGYSRNIFHGVTSISADTAPKTLLEETNLRHGRLNLTFRQY